MQNVEEVNYLKEHIRELEIKLEKTENELRKSEYLFQKVVELSPVAIYFYKQDKLIYVNEAGAKFLGIEKLDDIIGTTINPVSMSHPDYVNIINERINLLLSKEAKLPYMEQKFIRKDGTIVYGEVAAISFIDDGVMNRIVVVHDVTKRVRMKQSLKESEECFRGAFENAAIGMSLTSLDGKLIKVNKSMCKMTGYSEAELLERKYQDITHHEDASIDMEKSNDLIDNKRQSYHIEKRYIHKQGYIIWVLISISLVRDQGGNPLYFIAQIQDVTNVKQAKEALKYDELKTEFFANISHEVRTPINIILSTIQLLNMYLKKEQSSGNLCNIGNHLDTMRQNCYRTIRLINNFIDTTTIDSNFYNLSLQNYNIVQIIEDITLSVAEYIEGKGINLIFDTDIEEKIMACDPDKIERIILNLISNAVKFTEQDGNIKVSIKDKIKYIEISVQDDGIGIEEEKLKLIFERFGQINKSFVRNREGSGIGLSLVKSFVEMHEGNIEAKSKNGQGSKFIIKLPVKVIQEENLMKKEKRLSQLNDSLNKNVEKVNIEFSDIYL